MEHPCDICPSEVWKNQKQTGYGCSCEKYLEYKNLKDKDQKPLNEIEQFIHDFRFQDEKVLTRIFTKDYCFHFAAILKAVFQDGDIFYDVIPGHFVFELDGKFYDVTGEVDPNKILVPFDQLEFYDELVYKRVIKNCVLKVE